MLATAVLTTVLAIAAAFACAASLGIRPHVEVSDSMRPLLRAGDVLWLEDLPAREAARGDVVAFARPARRDVVLHRVERITPAGSRLTFTTRGDANTGTESWTIPADGRIGRYGGVRIPAAGRAVRAAQGPPLAVVALLSGLCLGGGALRRIWR